VSSVDAEAGAGRPLNKAPPSPKKALQKLSDAGKVGLQDLTFPTKFFVQRAARQGGLWHF
jgi:hypothetical protein